MDPKIQVRGGRVGHDSREAEPPAQETQIMMTRNTKTRLATAGASLALVAAISSAGFAMPSDAAWAATGSAGLTQVQQAASPTPEPGPGRGHDQREHGPR